MIALIVILVLFGIAGIAVAIVFYAKKRKKKNSQSEGYGNSFESNRSYVTLKEKYMLRKEFKVLCIVERALPAGYFAVPKVAVGLLLEPFGTKAAFDKIKEIFLDVVVFDENSLKPIVVIDLFDSSTGDLNLSESCPQLRKAFDDAGLPVLLVKVKFDYTDADIADPIKRVIFG